MQATASSVSRWERWIARVPFGALLIATVAALAAGPHLGATTPVWRLVTQLVLVALVALWMWWCNVARPELGRERPWAIVYYAVRTALALALTLLNPLFCIFAWVGYIDAHAIFRGRARWAALGVSAAIMALGQGGGIPAGLNGQLGLFAVLFVLNFGLAAVFSSYGTSMARSNDERAAVITELEALNAELEHALAENAQLQQTVVAQARAAGVEQERARLAREIHDTIAQSLAGVLTQLQAAQEESGPAVRNRVGQAAELAREALAEARRSVMNLAPAPLSTATLPEAVTTLVGSWGAQHAIRADAVITGDQRELHPEVEAAVLRVVQEALSNVAKHARAARVGVTLSYEDGEVIVDVRDDGVGFDPAAAIGSDSFGLRGMRQRASRLAGSFEVEAAPGAGVAVCVRFPALVRSAA